LSVNIIRIILVNIKKEAMPPSLLIATGNSGKQREMCALLSSLALDLLSLHDVDVNRHVDEIGTTYEENARLKAIAYHKLTGLPVLAEDSGLEVKALDGAPGVYSARFSPKENATDADRRAHLLALLEGKPHPWEAHFHCTAVLALPDGTCLQTTGRCTGIIIPEERGTGGFGYDPVFFLPKYGATMAELPFELKNQISHRARAIQAILPLIQANLID
jgi:XTP/dITP diphosphohydrolase